VRNKVYDHSREQIRFRDWQSQRCGTFLHARDVIIEPENVALAVFPSVRLEALEARACIVKNVRCRMHC